MKHINAMLNDKQADIKTLFEIAFEHALYQDITMCDLLPEEIDALREVLL